MHLFFLIVNTHIPLPSADEHKIALLRREHRAVPIYNKKRTVFIKKKVARVNVRMAQYHFRGTRSKNSGQSLRVPDEIENRFTFGEQERSQACHHGVIKSFILKSLENFPAD